MMTPIVLSLALALGGAAAALAAAAPSHAPTPAPAHGPVLAVEDGATLWVALRPERSGWVRIQLADAPASASWGALMAVAFAKTVDCDAPDAAGRSVCRIGDRSLGAVLTDSAVVVAGAAWRRPTIFETRPAAVAARPPTDPGASASRGPYARGADNSSSSAVRQSS